MFHRSKILTTSEAKKNESDASFWDGLVRTWTMIQVKLMRRGMIETFERQKENCWEDNTFEHWYWLIIDLH